MKTKTFAQRLLMLLLLPALQGHATVGENLTFTVGGKPVVIALADHPVITYTNNTLHVKTADKTIDLPVSEITGGSFQKQTVHGDVNGDYAVDVADIATIISTMAGAGDDLVSARADVNNDGVVDVADISTVITIMAGK